VLHLTTQMPEAWTSEDRRGMFRMWELLDALEARGLLAADATYDEFESLMARLERESAEPPTV
jgi:hypothetical protein